MLRKSILSIVAIIICILLFSGCDDKSADQMQLELEQVKATLDKTQAELKIAQSELEEAKKWKDEYDKLYVRNQNLEGQLMAQKQQVLELADRIARDQETIIKLQDELKNKILTNPFNTP